MIPLYAHHSFLLLLTLRIQLRRSQRPRVPKRNTWVLAPRDGRATMRVSWNWRRRHLLGSTSRRRGRRGLRSLYWYWLCATLSRRLRQAVDVGRHACRSFSPSLLLFSCGLSYRKKKYWGEAAGSGCYLVNLWMFVFQDKLGRATGGGQECGMSIHHHATRPAYPAPHLHAIRPLSFCGMRDHLQGLHVM